MRELTYSGQTRPRVVVTGVGVYSPIGHSPEALLERIQTGRGGIHTIQGFDTTGLEVHHGAEILDHDPLAHFTPEEARMLDPTAQFAVIAARQAMAGAGIGPEIARDRIAVVMGVCAGGQGDSNNPRGMELDWETPEAARTFLRTGHSIQTEAVVAALDVHGPQVTLSTACASSASALGYALKLLQLGKADVVLAGGADAFSLWTYAGFYALGAMARKACSPFSEGIGVTFGEGAGFVVLERLDDATARGAHLHGELFGFGTSGDAHHMTSPHPTGEGLRLAMQRALADARLTREEVDYINAHGTGTRDNDSSETLAIKRLYQGAARIPPVSSSKSFFGHTLGAAGILEFIVSLLCTGKGLLPPTLNFTKPRAVCDLDYVPNEARPAAVRHFLSNSAAFGGVNAVVAGGAVHPSYTAPRLRLDEVAITGLGVVSPIGCTLESFLRSLRERQRGIGPVDRFTPRQNGSRSAGLVRDFQPRLLLPTIDTRRLDRLNQYTTVAAGLALKDAGLPGGRIPEERLGVVVSLTRGPVSTQEQFLQSLRQNGIEQLSPKHFPSMVVSTVAGHVSQAFRLRGLASTVVEGTGSGLHALIHAYELLRESDTLDAVVVVAADEVGALFYRLYERLGLLAPGEHDDVLRPYDPEAEGMVLGEGAAALVLERRTSVRARGARSRALLQGCGQTADGRGPVKLEPEGLWLEKAMRQALAEARVEVDGIDAIYGHGRGDRAHDVRELHALRRLLGQRQIPVGCVLGNTGVAEAASSLFSVAAAVLGQERGEAYPILSGGPLPRTLDFVHEGVRAGTYRRTLIVASTESGNNAAVVLGHEEQP